MKRLLCLIACFLPIFTFAEVSEDSSKFDNDKIIISEAWARPTFGKKRVTAVYMNIKNTGSLDYLTSVSTQISAMADIHKTVTEQGVSQMVHIDRLAIPENSTVELKPKGLHIMVMGLYDPLKEGEKFDLVLDFKHAGSKVIEVPVKSMKKNDK